MKDEDILKKEKDVLKDEQDSHETDKKIILTVLKRHKIGLLLVIFLIMVSSTFAWFIYNKTVDMALHAHVKAWNIQLGEEDESEDKYEISIDALYPGMTSIDTTVAGGGIPIVNNGELAADISIRISSLTLFGVVQEAGKDYELVVSDDGKTFTVEGYPFVLTFTLGASKVSGGGGTSALNYSLVWDFDNDEAECMQDEDGNQLDYNRCDAEDTELGEKSYEFSEANKDLTNPPSSLIIEMEMDVTQSAGQ